MLNKKIIMGWLILLLTCCATPQISTTNLEETKARQKYQQARLAEDKGDWQTALTHYQSVIFSFPAEAAADDSLRRICIHFEDRQEDLRLVNLLLEYYPRLSSTEIGDQILYLTAQIYQRHNHLAEARQLYDRLVLAHPKSPLLDNSLWQAGQISEKLSQWDEAIKRYQALVRLRKTAWFSGSYNSVYLDDAQMRIGLLGWQKLHDLARARAALEELRDDFKDSTLRDDASWELAQMLNQNGERPKACHELKELVRRFPDGNYFRRAQELATLWGC